MRTVLSRRPEHPFPRRKESAAVMPPKLRLVVFAASAVAALATAATALAAYTPKLSASSDLDGTTLALTSAATDDPTASLTLYVPADWVTNTSLIPGDQIGTILAGSGGGAPVTGTLTAATATQTLSVGGVDTPISTLAASCTGTAAHAAYWLVNVGGSQSLSVPVYVDLISPGTSQADYASFTLRLCLPPPTGTRITTLAMKVTGAFTPPVPAWYIWRAVATPYAAGTTANQAGSVEIQSFDRYPTDVSLTAKLAKGTRQATVTGRVLAGAVGVPDATVQIVAGNKAIGKATTDKRGRFTTSVALPRPGVSLTAVAIAAAQPRTGCQEAAFAPLPCVSSTNGGFTATSEPVKATR
jgi:hypothetical protein